MSAAGRPIVISQGDPAGIGPEIIARAFAQAPETMRGCVVAGDGVHMGRAAALFPSAGGLQAWRPGLTVPGYGIPLWPVATAAAAVPWGQVNASAGALAAEALRQAARAVLAGQMAALVTAPLNKQALSLAGIEHPGHTEMLQQEAAVHRGVSVDAVPVRMMLANDELRVVLVSIHVPLRAAIDQLTAEAIVQTLRIADADIGRALGRRPCLAVAGLNPHAGEGGLFGREEIDIVAPAIQQACAAGIDASGPWPPDTVFMQARRGRFDAVIAMYHDQGLIPIKYLGVGHGVNATLGLPFVRTSPDHGTAFDIAGQGVADAGGLIAAVAMARRLSGAQER